MEAAEEAGDGMLSVRAFRRHFAELRGKMAQQDAAAAAGAGAADGPAVGGAVALLAGTALQPAGPARLGVSDLRTGTSTYDVVEERIKVRLAELATQQATAQQVAAQRAAAAAAEAQAAAQRAATAAAAVCLYSQKFEQLRQHILSMTEAQIAALNPEQMARYNTIRAKIQAKEEVDRRLAAQKRQEMLLESRQLAQHAAAAASSVARRDGPAPPTSEPTAQLMDHQPNGVPAAAAAAAAAAPTAAAAGGAAAAGAAGALREDEAILTCRMFFHGRGAMQPAQELEVIGSQPLSALVDQVSCLYDRPEVSKVMSLLT